MTSSAGQRNGPQCSARVLTPMSGASLEAMTNFLLLGLRNYAVDLTAADREYAVYEALYNLATEPLPPGDDTTLGSDEGSLLAKWWDYMAFAPP